MNLDKYKGLKRKYKDYVNINPIQTGGRLTQEAENVLEEYGHGYSVCDFCKGALTKIRKPPIHDFIHEDLPEFLNCDAVRVTHGAREGVYKLFETVANKGDTVIIDENRHYTTDVAAERIGLEVIKVGNNGAPEYEINVEDYEKLIKEHDPGLVLLTYPDGSYGNLPDARKLGKLMSDYEDIPLVLNCAYSIGRMPVDAKELGADFVVGSGHKSMASTGPIGVIGMSDEWSSELIKKSKTHEKKEVEFLGCSVRGVPLITLMASFPQVVERVEEWDEEVLKARWFSKEMEELGLEQLGEKPHNHDLLNFKTDLFYEISQEHPEGRGFLYEELKKNGIFGVKHGYTKGLKISTYRISKEDLRKILHTFSEVINDYA